MGKFILIIIAIILCILFYYVGKKAIEESKKDIYVYPKTGNQYKVLFRCKMKLPIERNWIEAVIYMSLKDDNFYVRERKDFFDKFVKLLDWETSKDSG